MESELESCLKKSFNYDFFRPLQKEIITDMTKGNDMIVLMPTGAGKSICYQLPALFQGGLTVIISPLLSLIYDQIADLKKHNILAHYLCTGASVSISEILKDVLSLKCCLLYTTPETFNNNLELNLNLEIINKKGMLRRFIIDEAHCLSNWGHDFRSEYLKMDIRGKYESVPICGFTATATKLVSVDIIERLELREPLLWMTSYVKQNISYRIKQKAQDTWHYIDLEVLKVAKEHIGDTGIIYCLSRKQCEHLAEYLSLRGIKSAYYHASMPIDKKTQVQQDWLDGKIKVIVATIAFALGINKPDVRYVLHTSMPTSIEGYYQQAGRAGRDGNISKAILYYSAKDREVLENMIDYTVQSKESPVSQIDRISEIYFLSRNSQDCIKVQLSTYLGETNVINCISRADSAPCYVCSIRGETAINTSLISKIYSILTPGVKVDIFKLRLALKGEQERRILNYLINKEVIKTSVVGSQGKYIEYAWIDNYDHLNF